MTLVATSSNPALIPDPTIDYTSGSTTATLNYASNLNQFGTTVITVTLMDDGGVDNSGDDTTVVSFTVEVTPVNYPPTANDDLAATDEDTLIVISASELLSNDDDVDSGDTLALTLPNTATSLRGAVVRINGDGNVEYDPSAVLEFQQLSPGESIEDSFTYVVSDGTDEDTGTVTVTVSGIFDYQNASNPLDVNKDGFVSPLDALIIVNTLNRLGPRLLGGIVGVPEFCFDVNGDGSVSPIDVLLIVNFLNGPQREGEGVAAETSSIGHAEQQPALFVMLDLRSLDVVSGSRRQGSSAKSGSEESVPEYSHSADTVLAEVQDWSDKRSNLASNVAEYDFDALPDVDLEEFLSNEGLPPLF